MYNFKSLKCYNCNSVMLNLPEKEVARLNDSHFRCECCGHLNLLKDFKFSKDVAMDISNVSMENHQILQSACM